MEGRTPDISLVLYRLSEVERVLREIRDEVRTTNGRLRDLERWRARLEGVHAGWSWLMPVVTGVVSALAVTLLMRLVG